MKQAAGLVWLTQLGLSVVIPPAALIFLAVWLQRRFQWGSWVIWVGIALGIYCAVTALISSLRTLSRLTEDPGKQPPPPSFNEHN